MNQYSVQDRSAVARAVGVLRAERVALYPTDTLYGLGADALSNDAVDRVYQIKGRDERKPIHCIVADIAMAERYAVVDDVARKLAKRFFPGALTLILKKKEGMNAGICRGIDTIGIRIPDNDFCLALAREFDGPITTTSANRAGEDSLSTAKAILDQLGDNAEMIDLVIDAGELPLRAPSSVVDLSGERPVILREGAIASDLVWEELVDFED